MGILGALRCSIRDIELEVILVHNLSAKFSMGYIDTIVQDRDSDIRTSLSNVPSFDHLRCVQIPLFRKEVGRLTHRSQRGSAFRCVGMSSRIMTLVAWLPYEVRL